MEANDALVTPRSPWETVSASLQAFNTGELEASLAYYAKDVVVKLNGVPPGEPDTHNGIEEARVWLQGLLEEHFEIREELIEADGDTVKVKALSWSDLTRQLDVAPLEATEVYIVKNGEIASLAWTISPDSAAKLQAALSRSSACIQGLTESNGTLTTS